MAAASISLLPGDIVLVRSKGIFAWLIRQFTRTAGEKRTMVNHVGVMVDQTNLVEALQTTMKHDLRSRYAGSAKAQIAIYRWIGLTDDQRAAVATKAVSYVGRKYGWLKILAHGLDRIIGGRNFFRWLAREDKYPICSWVVAYSYRVIGKDFGVPPNAADPDHIWDYCVENDTKSQFDEIFPLGTLT